MPKLPSFDATGGAKTVYEIGDSVPERTKAGIDPPECGKFREQNFSLDGGRCFRWDDKVGMKTEYASRQPSSAMPGGTCALVASLRWSWVGAFRSCRRRPLRL